MTRALARRAGRLASHQTTEGEEPGVREPCKLAEKPDADKDIRFLDQAELGALIETAGVRYRHTPKTLERAGRVRTLRDVRTAIYLYRCEPDSVSISDADLRRVDRVLYLTAAMTGLRQGELLALRWMDVDWLARKIRVRRNYVRGKFGTPKSKRSSLDRSQVAKRFKAALRRAGVREVRFPDLRHTFGTRCAAQGVPMRTLEEWMEHRDIKTTDLRRLRARRERGGARKRRFR